MTERVSLRAVEDGDLPILFEYYADPVATRMASFPSRDRDAFMAHWAKCRQDPTVILRTIVFDGEVAGNVVCWERDGVHEVGYWIGREHWGKGIASEALSQFLARVEIRPLVAHVAKHNAASLRVTEKCGFAITGEAQGPGATEGELSHHVLVLGPSGT